MIDEGGPVTANGPSGSRSRFRDEVGVSAAVGEDPATEAIELKISTTLIFIVDQFLHWRWPALEMVGKI